MYIHLHVKHPLFFTDQNQNCIFWTDFRIIFKYQISGKFLQYGLSHSMRTDMTKPNVGFRHVVNAPKKRNFSL